MSRQQANLEGAIVGHGEMFQFKRAPGVSLSDGSKSNQTSLLALELSKKLPRMEDRLDEFPQPNPHFPSPPRQVEGWSWRGVAVFATIFVASIAVIVLMIADVFTTPFDMGPLLALLAVLGVVVGALGGPLAFYNAWRLHPWRYGEIVPAAVVRERRTGNVMDGLYFLAVKFIPIIGYLVWLWFGGQSVKVAYIRRGVRCECGAVLEKDDLGPPEGAIVWVIRPRFPFTARLVSDEWFPAVDDEPPMEVQGWLTRALERADKKYTHKGANYNKQS